MGGETLMAKSIEARQDELAGICPGCKGSGKVSITLQATWDFEKITCPTCKGKGVVINQFNEFGG